MVPCIFKDSRNFIIFINCDKIILDIYGFSLFALEF